MKAESNKVLELLQAKMNTEVKKNLADIAKLQAQLKDRAGGTKRKVTVVGDGGAEGGEGACACE